MLRLVPVGRSPTARRRFREGGGIEASGRVKGFWGQLGAFWRLCRGDVCLRRSRRSNCPSDGCAPARRPASWIPLPFPRGLPPRLRVSPLPLSNGAPLSLPRMSDRPVPTQLMAPPHPRTGKGTSYGRGPGPSGPRPSRPASPGGEPPSHPQEGAHTRPQQPHMRTRRRASRSKSASPGAEGRGGGPIARPRWPIACP